MAIGTIMPLPRFTGFDANGDPVPGGLLWTYIAGTSTPVAVYSDVALTVPHANPIVLNSAGRPASGGSELGVYLTPGSSYKFVLQTATGATVWTQDNVAAVPTASQTVDIVGTAGEALPASNAVYLSSGARGKAAGQWFLTDADFPDASSAAAITGMTLAAIPLGAQGAIRTQGTIQYAGTPLTAGSVYYASSTAGGIQAAIPSPNVRIIGQALDASVLLLGGSNAGAYSQVANSDTGTVNNWAPGLFGNTIIGWSGTADLIVTGLVGGTPGQLVILKNGSPTGAVIYCPHNNGGSLAGTHWFNTATSGATPVAAGGVAMYYYGGSGWNLVSHIQGAWIDVPFSAANFAGGGGLTWTVASGNVTANRYLLDGRRLTWTVWVGATTLGGTPNTTLTITLPAGFTSQTLWGSAATTQCIDTAANVGLVYTQAGNVIIQKNTSANFAATASALMAFTVSFAIN